MDVIMERAFIEDLSSISGGWDVVMERAFIEDLSPFLGDGCCYGKEPLSRIYLHFWGMDVVMERAFIEDFISISGGWMLLWTRSLYRGFISISGRWMLLGNVSPVLEDECYYTRSLYQGFISISEWRIDVITQRACQGFR